MATRETCVNEYDKAFKVVMAGAMHAGATGGPSYKRAIRCRILRCRILRAPAKMEQRSFP